MTSEEKKARSACEGWQPKRPGWAGHPPCPSPAPPGELGTAHTPCSAPSRTWPQARGALPSTSASAPYVVTRPGGMHWITAYSRASKAVGGRLGLPGGACCPASTDVPAGGGGTALAAGLRAPGLATPPLLPPPAARRARGLAAAVFAIALLRLLSASCAGLLMVWLGCVCLFAAAIAAAGEVATFNDCCLAAHCLAAAAAAAASSLRCRRSSSAISRSSSRSRSSLLTLWITFQ